MLHFNEPIYLCNIITSHTLGEIINTKINGQYFLHSLILSSLGTSSSYSVLVLSPEDSQRDLVRTAADLCRSVLQRQIKVEDIDTSVVDSRVSGQHSFDVFRW